MNTSVIGLDIAKNIFHLYTLNADNKVIKKKLKRAEVLAFFANYPVSTITLFPKLQPGKDTPEAPAS